MHGSQRRQPGKRLQSLVADVHGIVEAYRCEVRVADEMLETVVPDRTVGETDGDELGHVGRNGGLGVAEEAASDGKLGDMGQVLQSIRQPDAVEAFGNRDRGQLERAVGEKRRVLNLLISSVQLDRAAVFKHPSGRRALMLACCRWFVRTLFLGPRLLVRNNRRSKVWLGPTSLPEYICSCRADQQDDRGRRGQPLLQRQRLV